MIILPQKISEMKESDCTFFIELYIVHLRTGDIFLSATDVDIDFAGHTFKAIPFKRETLSRSLDTIIDTCKISLGDGDYDKLAYICNGFDFRGCKVDILKIVYPDSLRDESLVQPIYSGELDNPSYHDGVFTCSIVAKFPRVTLPRRNSGLYCNCTFGDEVCRANPNITQEVVQTNSNRNVIKLKKSYTKDFWKDGIIILNGEARTILTSDTDYVKPIYSFVQDIIVGDSITLSRGCDKTPKCCKERFNNMKHYGGFPAVPRIDEYR